MDKKNLTTISKEIVNNKCSSVSSEVCSKLNQARQKALTESTKKPLLLSASWYLPATAVAALTFYLALPSLTTIKTTDMVAIEETVSIDEIELAEQIDLVEDLEFYQWLSDEDNLTSI